MINRLQIIKYSKSDHGIAHVKFVKVKDETKKTPFSMIRKIKMKSSKKTFKAPSFPTTLITRKKV